VILLFPESIIPTGDAKTPLPYYLATENFFLSPFRGGRMKNIVVKFGFLSGGLMALLLVLTFVFLRGPWIFEYGAPVGYAGMVLAFSVIFIGVKSYRDTVNQGSISFSKALQVGLLIAGISSLCYVAAWLVVHDFFFPDFMDQYAAHAIEKLRHSGAPEAAIQKAKDEMTQFKGYYANPFFRAAITFVEPSPVGIVVSLLTALILRKKPASQ